MKALNCANCGANLRYNLGASVAFCQYCDSVNVLENIQINIDATNSVDGPPSFYEELKPRVMLPLKKFGVSFEGPSIGGIGIQGGNLLLNDTEIFFKPNSLNWAGGDLSDKYMKISDIDSVVGVDIVFGRPMKIRITDKTGKFMIVGGFFGSNNHSIMAEIETRKNNLI